MYMYVYIYTCTVIYIDTCMYVRDVCDAYVRI